MFDIKEFIKFFNIYKHMHLNIAQYNEEMHFINQIKIYIYMNYSS